MNIDNTYFNGILEIPNTKEPEPNNRSNDLLTNLINHAKNYVLSMSLGVEMAKDVIDNSGNYRDLIHGEIYMVNGNKRFWNGLIQEDSKTSLIADYVYYIYRTHNITQSSEFGEISFEAKTGQRVSSTPKLTKIWNRFLEKYQGGVMYGYDGLTPEGNPYWIMPNRLNNGFGIDYYGYTRNNENVSLLRYLKENQSKYPLLKGMQSIGNHENSFGI